MTEEEHSPLFASYYDYDAVRKEGKEEGYKNGYEDGFQEGYKVAKDDIVSKIEGLQEGYDKETIKAVLTVIKNL